MTASKQHFLLTIFLIIVTCANLFNVRSVHADGETPTEPPAATEVATEASTEAPTEVATEATPVPVEATATPIAEVLTQVPESTEVAILDESGSTVPLATEEAAQLTQGSDPIWCPEGVLPGGAGCSTSYNSINDLLDNIISNTDFYAQNGVIYFTTAPGTGTLNLSPTTLAGDFDTLKNHNLTIQGGWNGDTVSPSFSGQTDMGNHPITIGSSSNPWVGNIALNDITFCGNVASACSAINQTALTVYTSSGNISLENVDVNNQSGGNNTALLDSTSGDISVNHGTYDGNNSNSAGFSAKTDQGSITISNTSFTENKKFTASNNSNGATLSAPNVTLMNVTSTGNDGNGIKIDNADIVTLNNVMASSNGTDVLPSGFTNNVGSGVFFDGNFGSSLFITGGAFNNNYRYGVEIGNAANTTVYVRSDPTCTGNAGDCYNVTAVSDNTPPVIVPNISGTLGLNGWYTSDVSLSWSVSDDESGILSSTGCTASNLTSNTGGTTLTCSATNHLGLSNSVSVTIKIDRTASGTPVPTSQPSSGSSTAGTSDSQANASAFIIPLTGGEVIHLGCNSVFSAFGIKLSFINLCDYQTILKSVDGNDLPGSLPDGFTFIIGLDLSILRQNQLVESLPNESSIQMDFPIAGAKDQFAVLFWNGSEWVQVSQQTMEDPAIYQVSTTEPTGIYVLVKK